jgi:hypothetical protein
LQPTRKNFPPNPKCNGFGVVKKKKKKKKKKTLKGFSGPESLRNQDKPKSGDP